MFTRRATGPITATRATARTSAGTAARIASTTGATDAKRVSTTVGNGVTSVSTGTAGRAASMVMATATVATTDPRRDGGGLFPIKAGADAAA